MEYLIVCLAALTGSALTLFSGFGLGTILLPVFALFFPLPLAIALTAIVHFLNNLFKLALLGRHANKFVIIRFGIPSVIAAFLGAWFLNFLGEAPAIGIYELGARTHYITWLKIVIGTVLAFFALFDMVPVLSKMQFDSKYMVAGGMLSGFFGGLSGNQGALRSAFLLRMNLSKETFIATGVVIACLVDVSRLFVYSRNIADHFDFSQTGMVLAATLCAFTGAFAGNKFMKKVTLRNFQFIVGLCLIVFAVLLGFGII